MTAMGKGLITLCAIVLPGSLFAEAANDFFVQAAVGAVSSFKQSTGQSPTVEIGVWKPLSIRDRRTTGIYVAHGGAGTTVRPNSLIAAGDKSVLLTHLLVFHSFELAKSWTGFLEYGISIAGFDYKGTSLSLAGFGFGAGIGYNLWKNWLLTLRARHVEVDQSYRGERILHRQLSGSVGLAVPVNLPGFPFRKTRKGDTAPESGGNRRKVLEHVVSPAKKAGAPWYGISGGKAFSTIVDSYVAALEAAGDEWSVRRGEDVCREPRSLQGCFHRPVRRLRNYGSS